LIFVPFSQYSTIINIPSDQPFIQQGIDVAAANDTILIADGTYYENLQIIGKEIMLASWFIIDADSSHIENTIIDGSSYTSADEASVIAFLPGSDPNAVPRIIGLTLINGFGWKVEETIQDVTIEKKVGGGLFIENLSPVFSHNQIKNNAVEDEGGGGYVLNGSPNFGGEIINEGNWNWQRVINPGGNVFLDNYAAAGKTFYAKSVTDTILAENCHFDVYSSTDSDVSSYWATTESGFSFHSSRGKSEAIISDVYVSPTGNDSLNSGLSPISPFQHIWFALSQVYGDSLNPVTIHIAAGTYSPTSNNEQFPLQIPEYVTLSGENYRDDTVLDAEDSHGVIIISNSENINMESFTIQNGNAEFGGGIYCLFAQVNMFDIQINNNYANRSGGGICFNQCSNLNIENCILDGNYAENTGGGSYIINSINITFADNLISANYACAGSGVRVYNSYMDFENNVFQQNTGSDSDGQGGGIWILGLHYNSYYSFNGDHFIGNYSDLGGGINCAGPAQFTNVLIQNNTARDGAGLYCSEGSAGLDNVLLKGNIAIGNGGAAFIGNSIPNWHKIEISGNQAVNGAGIYATWYSDSEMSNITFTRNIASGIGGAFYCTNYAVHLLSNSILWDNTPNEIFVNSGNVYVDYSDVQGGWTGTCNIDSDPLFVDASSGDYHLTLDSPCIDTGSPWEWYNDPDGTRCDMGVYYFNQTSLASPDNIMIEIFTGFVQISWDEIDGASYYNIYSSSDPYISFEYWILEESAMTETNWSELISEDVKFYYIKAFN